MTIREIRGKEFSFEIQQATPNQAETLTQIAFAAKRYWGYPEHWIQIWSPILTITPEIIEKHDTYVAYVNEKPVGFYVLSLNGTKAILEHLWVLPEHIGKGVGRKLFEHALSRCKEIGTRILEIESDPNARGFYERMGTKKVGEVIGEVDGQPRILPLMGITL